MTTQPVTCASCGAQLQIDDEIDHLTCTYCGTAQIVRRGDGYIALKIVDQLTQVISEMGERTESTIRTESDETQAELRRLHLRQELSAVQLQLASVQAEIRSLQRGNPSGQSRSQMRDLRTQESGLRQRLAALSAALGEEATGSPATTGTGSAPAPIPGEKSQMVTLLLAIFFGVFGVHRFYTGHILIGVIQLITVGGFGLWLLIDLVMIGLGTYTDARGQRLASRNPRVARGCAFGTLTYAVVFFLCGTVARILEPATDAAGEAANAGPLITLAGMSALAAGILVLVWLTSSEQIMAVFRGQSGKSK